MYELIFLDGTTITLHEATREQLVKWINEAPSIESRNARKKITYGAMYSSGPQKLIDVYRQSPEGKLK